MRPSAGRDGPPERRPIRSSPRYARPPPPRPHSSQAPYPDERRRASSGWVPDRSIQGRLAARRSASETPGREYSTRWVGAGMGWLIYRINGDYGSVVTHSWQSFELTSAYGRISLTRPHDVSEAASMKVIWYPGCGQDFKPVLTLLRSNPRRDHVPQRAPKDDGPILWMTDYCPEVIRFFDRLKPR